jgi:hypothetical protein
LPGLDIQRRHARKCARDLAAAFGDNEAERRALSGANPTRIHPTH